jgi:hypothetical protein
VTIGESGRLADHVTGYRDRSAKGEVSMLQRGLLIAAVACGLQAQSANPASRSTPTLDYGFFTKRVEPIFLEKRPGHTRCYVCHAESNNAFRLEKLTPGATFWSEAQSRQNFEMTSTLVNPGDPATSPLLFHALAPEAGGDIFHSGGRQFRSKNDPAWKSLAQWVNGAKLGDDARK